VPNTLFQYKMSLKGRSCWDVNIRMDNADKLRLQAIGWFIAASEEIQFKAEDRQQLYAGSSAYSSSSSTPSRARRREVFCGAPSSA